MAQTIFTISPEMQSTWDDLMGQMCAFVDDNFADVDMAYDWVCEMLDIDSFVDNEAAWNSFYQTWESCDNRNTMEYAIIWLSNTNYTGGWHQQPSYDMMEKSNTVKHSVYAVRCYRAVPRCPVYKKA